MFAFFKVFCFPNLRDRRILLQYFVPTEVGISESWENEIWKWWPRIHESKLSDNTQFLLILQTMLSVAMCILRPIKI